MLVVRLAHAIAPTALSAQAIQQLTYQSALYVFLTASLCVTAQVRHQQSPIAALALRPQFRGAWYCVLGAPILAFATAAMGAILRAPAIPNPAERLIAGRASLVVVGIFAVLLGPAFEEIAFRGFLQPLLRRYIAPWPAILLTAIPFALLHGVQNEWAWQSLLLIWFAGACFGATRYWTGSTAASILLHSGYNLTLFTAYVVQSAQIPPR
jgi:hypothetical protein